MVSDKLIRRLWTMLNTGASLAQAASQVGIDEKTARKYRDLGKLPSELETPHTWKTHPNPFEGVWEQVTTWLHNNNGMEAKRMFRELQKLYPGRFEEGQLRTFQRRVQHWKATEGPPKEVFFTQTHKPGDLAESDFTNMNKLNVTIQGQPFKHMAYHFVLTHSNWESVTVCFSETFEALSEGLQNALWKLGGIPKRHQTDQLTAAVQNEKGGRTALTQRYQEILGHYGIEGQYTQPRRPNENGDVEQRHHRFKKALDQELTFRGSRDFESQEAYEGFVQKVIADLNISRHGKLEEERKALAPLPKCRVRWCQKFRVRVSKTSLIRVLNNAYSVDSRLIKKKVEVRVYPNHLSVWFGQGCVEESIPRLSGKHGHRIEYRHVIDWLVRKPGAFEQYRYREDLFPTTRFRIAYDILKRQSQGDTQKSSRDYLQILLLAAKENETAVDDTLRHLIDENQKIDVEKIQEMVRKKQALPKMKDVEVAETCMETYDALLGEDFLASSSSKEEVA